MINAFSFEQVLASMQEKYPLSQEGIAFFRKKYEEYKSLVPSTLDNKPLELFSFPLDDPDNYLPPPTWAHAYMSATSGWMPDGWWYFSEYIHNDSLEEVLGREAFCGFADDDRDVVAVFLWAMNYDEKAEYMYLAGLNLENNE